MSNIVSTWKKEANPAGETELTDTQLMTVYGAWGDVNQTVYEDNCSPRSCGWEQAGGQQSSGQASGQQGLVWVAGQQTLIPAPAQRSLVHTHHEKHVVSFQLSFQKEDEVSEKTVATC